MALVNRKNNYHIRPNNKEPEWSNICNNVFNQYLDGDDVFAFDGGQREGSNSDEICHLLGFSASSEQDHQIPATSPMPSQAGAAYPERVETEAKQPKAKAPGIFWTNKLRALERNAAECEERQQILRATRSQPDFLTVDRYPSPPPMPPSPTDQSYSTQRRTSRSRVPASNGSKTPTQRTIISHRSTSCGRPSGIIKPPASAPVDPCTTLRKHNASPPKMMNLQRYRAGFKDVWAERTQQSPKKYELRSSDYTSSDSPPPSARLMQDNFATSGSPTAAYLPISGCDGQISPLTKTFQQAARLNTPSGSPKLPTGDHVAPSYFALAPYLPQNSYLMESAPVNDTTPLFSANDSLTVNRTESFDFGFSSPTVDDIWSAAPLVEPSTASHHPEGHYHEAEPLEIPVDVAGLDVSCDPKAISNYTMNGTRIAFQRRTDYPPPPPPPAVAANMLYVPSLPSRWPMLPPRPPYGLPITPSRRGLSTMPPQEPNRSPSPPATDSRSRRPSRRASGHRRAKSTNSTSRRPHGVDKVGFVNFTPEDGNKILNGVAPSGSSKTKARREKEAAEKRRRLSQAAIKAVIDAGGDVESLQKAGLMVA